MKSLNYQTQRNRQSIDCSHPILTDQSSKNMCDINKIVAQYAKTGMLPQFQQKIPQYGDFSNLPTLAAAMEIVQEAKQQFMELPANIRKLMDNDPRKFETFLQDPTNHETLLKAGLIVQKPIPHTQHKVEGIPPETHQA